MSNNLKFNCYDESNKGEGVLVIYTGGTIGSMPKDREDKSSPQVVISWSEFKKNTPQLSEKTLGFNVDAYTTQPLDSCNIGPKEWQEIAKVIAESYNKYFGFVLLHGTDTMVYTASALSFMLRNLGKPVILTGAQVSHTFNVWNDSLMNMIGALNIANPKYTEIPIIPEVCIFFNGNLFRGNRTHKKDASSFYAYESPNYPKLAEYGESIVVHKKTIREIPKGDFYLKSSMNTHVVSVFFFPGIQDSKVLENILSIPDLKGVVFLAYGAGNIPTQKNIMDLVKKTADKRIICFIVTQTGGGQTVLGMYDTSAKLIDAGAISGVDILPETALVKLMHILGDEDIKYEDAILDAQKSIAGEMSLSIYPSFVENKGKISGEHKRERIGGFTINNIGNSPETIDRVILRLKNGSVETGSLDHLLISIYRGLSSEDELNKANFVGTFRQIEIKEKTVLFYDITKNIRSVISNGRESFTVVLENDEGQIEWDGMELVIFIKE